MNELRKVALQNKKGIIQGLRRYLFYNYDITELIEDVVEKSLKNIENIKSNYGDSGAKEQEKQIKLCQSLKR